MEQLTSFENVLTSITQWLEVNREALPPVAAFVVVAGTLILAWRIVRRRTARHALRQQEEESGNGIFVSLAPALAAQLPESPKASEEFEKRLRGAGYYSPHSKAKIYALRFLALIVPMTIAGAIAVYRAPHDTFNILLVGGIVAAVLSVAPRVYVYFRRRQRLNEIREGLPDAMDMLSMCMEGGISVGESLSQVAARLDNYPALAQELSIVRRQAEVGSLTIALSELSKRIDLPEVRGLCSLLSRGDRLGTEVSGTLLEQSDHLRTQRRQRATLRVNKAPVKLVLPLVFCFAPTAMILLVSPAVLELKEFLAPSSGQSVLTASDGMAGANQIVERLRDLEQDVLP